MRFIKLSKPQPLRWLIWLVEGIVVGFGAILPGVSGATLCVAFGMYRPIIDTVSNIKSGLKKHGIMLSIFIIGLAVGFVGLSGLAAFLMKKNTVAVTCAFIGFIIGILPDLWQSAGEQGRTKKSYFSVFAGFIVMIIVLSLLRTTFSVTITPGIPGFFISGLLWGLSFIVPGLSSSTLLLFFGIYEPMLDGISALSLPVIVPMGFGLALCVLLLSKAIGLLFDKYYSTISHAVFGIVVATTVMIIPSFQVSFQKIALYILIIIVAAFISYGFTLMNKKLEKAQ